MDLKLDPPEKTWSLATTYMQMLTSNGSSQQALSQVFDLHQNRSIAPVGSVESDSPTGMRQTVKMG